MMTCKGAGPGLYGAAVTGAFVADELTRQPGGGAKKLVSITTNSYAYLWTTSCGKALMAVSEIGITTFKDLNRALRHERRSHARWHRRKSLWFFGA
jgi:hypothetical protein